MIEKNKPIVSLCIPTDGNVQWVIPVIESIYSQDVDNDLFEVIIADNGTESNLSDALSAYNYPNLKYFRSDCKGFTNINFSLTKANGMFRKMINHRSCLLPGTLKSIIELIEKYKESRPIIYFSDDKIPSDEDIIECDNFDDFISNLHYWISWSAGIGVWEEDVSKLAKLNPNEMFPHIAIMLDIRNDSHCVIWNGKYQKMLNDAGKGGYNLYHTFAEVFLNIMLNYVKIGKISQSTYKKTKKRLFSFLTRLYFQEVMIPSHHNFDLTGIRHSMSTHYSKIGYILMITSATYFYLKYKLKKIIKRILEKMHLLKYLDKIRTQRRERKMKKLFAKNRLAVIKEFDYLLTMNNINYSIAFGTLLGAVREGGFISHDMDIDAAIWYETDYRQIERILTSNGFELIRRAETDNGNFSREDTYVKDGVLIDIFTFYPYNDNLSYTTVFVPFDGCETFDESIKKIGGVMPVQLLLPYSKITERIPFESIDLPAIINRNDFILAKYGDNWRKPDPSYEYTNMREGFCKFRPDKVTKVLVWK